MIARHSGKVPRIHDSALIAPNAMICGDVNIGRNVRIMFGAQLIAENSPITIGDNCIILENAVIRGTAGFPVTFGNNCLIGPNAHLAGCSLADNVFIATGASIFHGARLGANSEVRINGVVHIKSVLPEGATVPINWIAVGDPAEIFSPEKHDDIWEKQKALNFIGNVYSVQNPQTDQKSIMPEICRIMSERLGSHLDDRVLDF